MSSDKRGIAVAYRSVGSDQTLQSPARAFETSYQNTTGRPILVSVWGDQTANAASWMTFATSPDNTTWTVNAEPYTTQNYYTVYRRLESAMLVPSNYYYRVTTNNTTLVGWRELR